MAEGPCALCGERAPLQVSHLIPRFVTLWVQKTSATGHVRRVVEPNLRVQDPAKTELLCTRCEGILSRDEAEFARRIFRPALNEKQFRFGYGGWLRRFAVGLAWRTAHGSREVLRKRKPLMAGKVDTAMAWWADFLLGKRRTEGAYEQHLFLIEEIESAGSAIPIKGLQWYVMRGIDATLAGNETSVAAYTKFPGFVFWSPIEPSVQPGWNGTLIESAGVIGSPQELIDDGSFGQFMIGRAALTDTALSKRSQRQVDKVVASILKNPGRYQQSKTAEARLAEARLDATRADASAPEESGPTQDNDGP